MADGDLFHCSSDPTKKHTFPTREPSPSLKRTTSTPVNIFGRFGMKDCNPVHTPRYGSELSNEQPEETLLLGATATNLYPGIVGLFVYLAQCARHDMCYSVKPAKEGEQLASSSTPDCSKTCSLIPEGPPRRAHHLQERTISTGWIRACIVRSQPRQAKVYHRVNLILIGGAISASTTNSESLVTQSTVGSELMGLSYVSKGAVHLCFLVQPNISPR